MAGIDLAAATDLTLTVTDDAAAIDALRRDVAHERQLRRAVFALAVELQRTVNQQQAIIDEQRAVWARCSARVMPCGDADV